MTSEINKSTKFDKDGLVFELFLKQNNITKSADFCHFKKEDALKGEIMNNGIYYELKELNPRTYDKDFKYDINDDYNSENGSAMVEREPLNISQEDIQKLINKSYKKKAKNLQSSDKCELIIWYFSARQNYYQTTNTMYRTVLNVDTDISKYEASGFQKLHFVDMGDLQTGEHC
jgi:hypothetical protein